MIILSGSPVAKRKANDQWLRALGERLRACRDWMGMTQMELAELLGVSPQAVGLWETGISSPSDEHKLSLAVLYDVSLDWLLGREQQVAEGRTPYDVRLVVVEEFKDIVEIAEEELSVGELRRVRDIVRLIVQQAQRKRIAEGSAAEES